jgi:hypothetical protein
VRLHRRVTQPLQIVRRGLLDRHGTRGERGEHGRIHADPPMPRAGSFEPPSQAHR